MCKACLRPDFLEAGGSKLITGALPDDEVLTKPRRGRAEQGVAERAGVGVAVAVGPRLAVVEIS